MKLGYQRFSRAAALSGIFVAVVAIGVTPALSAAAPGDGGLVADRPTLSLPALGYESDISLYGMQGTQTLTIPVPKGLTPSALTANVALPANVRGGTIIVSQQGRTLSRVELLLADDTPVTVPLTGAVVDDGTLTFELRSRLLPEEGECIYDPANPLQFTDAAIAYTGRETAPTVVADFLPPVLERMTIFIPRTPSLAESDAAVRLTTAVSAKYGKQNTDVDIEALVGEDMPPPSEPLARNVVIREGEDAAVSLQGGDGVPALQITGSADELDNQLQLLTSDLSRLALSSKTVAGPMKTAEPRPADQATIRDLGQPGVTAVAVDPQVFVTVDQTRLGRTARDVRVHLSGSYTPLPASIGGQIVVSVDGQTIDRWAVEDNGTIDRSVSIPNAMLTRSTELRVALDIAGDTGRCGEFEPVTLTIDGDTTIDSSFADPPVPVGFQSLPQAMLPKIDVGIGGEAFTDTVRAAAIMEGLQRLSGTHLDTEVMSLQDAIGSRSPAVLVAANGWDDETLTPPVRLSEDGTLDVESADGGAPATLTLDSPPRLGSLQTVRDGTRSVLIATSDGAPGLLDSLLAWLDSDAERWSSLDGIAVVAPPGLDPVVVNADTAQPLSSDDDGGISPWWWISVAALGLVGVGVVAAIVLRRRRV